MYNNYFIIIIYYLNIYNNYFVIIKETIRERDNLRKIVLQQFYFIFQLLYSNYIHLIIYLIIAFFKLLRFFLIDK